MVVVSCLLVSAGSFVLTGLGFQVVIRLACSIFLACELRHYVVGFRHFKAVRVNKWQSMISGDTRRYSPTT